MSNLEYDFERELPVVIPGTLGINYEALEAHARAIANTYKGVVVTDDNRTALKKVLAELNKLMERISAERIRVKKEYNLPVDEMEKRIKFIIAILGEAKDGIYAQIKADEEDARQFIRAIFTKQWETDQIDGIEFGQIYNPKWESNAMSMEAKLSAYTTEIDRIRGDLTFLAGLDNPLEATLATTEYKKVLNITKAQAYARDMMRVITVSKREPVVEDTPPTEEKGDHSFILGLDVKLEATGVKKEFKALYFRTDEDWEIAKTVLSINNVPFVE